VITLGARRLILLNNEIISAIVVGCSEAIIFVTIRGLSCIARKAATITVAASSEKM
jgi:hypothetical protein